MASLCSPQSLSGTSRCAFSPVREYYYYLSVVFPPAAGGLLEISISFPSVVRCLFSLCTLLFSLYEHSRPFFSGRVPVPLHSKFDPPQCNFKWPLSRSWLYRVPCSSGPLPSSPSLSVCVSTFLSSHHTMWHLASSRRQYTVPSLFGLTSLWASPHKSCIARALV